MPVVGMTKKPEHTIFCIIFVIALGFALITNHAWEDFYITYKVSKNLAAGNGPVYMIGEKLHVFTSPLNMLTLAFFNIVTRNISDVLVLWLYRVLCCFLLGLSGVFLFRISKRSSFGFFPTLLLIGLLATDAKIIDFGINGQEIAFMIFFIVMTLYGLMAVEKNLVLILGLSWAGLMWTRPDGFIYAGSMAIGFLLFNKAALIAHSRGELIKIYLKSAGLALILYAPWFFWSWSYYGTPIPHTIIAKGLNLNHIPLLDYLTDIILLPCYSLRGTGSPMVTFMPSYFYFGGWHPGVFVFSKTLSLVCLMYWAVPLANYQARAVSFGFFLCHYYLTFIAANFSPWYITNTSILAIFILANVIKDLMGSNRSITKFLKYLAVFIVLFNGIIFVCVAYQLRIQQKVIEEGNRKQIGLWLKENASSSDTVFLEPLGYIGFYSNLKILDYPGLSSREVVAVRKKFHTNKWEKLIAELKPNWVVRRPSDPISDKYLNTDYKRVKVFDVSRIASSYGFLPGRGYLNNDSVFFIYKRK